MNTIQVTIIGCGKMGEALIQALLDKEQFSLRGVEKDNSRREYLADKYNLSFYPDIDIRNLKDTDIFILAVKPQTIEPPLKDLRSILENRKNGKNKYKVVSIAAGIKLDFIKNIIGEENRDNCSLVRVMPNTPALVGEGFSALSFGPKVGDKDIKKIIEIFEQLGKTIRVDEDFMDLVTAVSGSGPAYFFLLGELLKEFAAENGIDSEKARRMAAQTAYGSGKLMAEGEKSIEQLREDVTSPGGTTEAALNFLKKSNYGEIFKKALEKARDRSIELSEGSEKKDSN